VKPIIAIVGLRREGSMLHQAGLDVIAGGGEPERLMAGLVGLTGSAAGIVSFGMAGALAETLTLGDWVIGDRLTGAFDALCDPRWVEALSRQLPGAHVGTIHSDGRMIVDPAEKRLLGRADGALAVDMESHIAAQAAKDAGLPFAILRCISDEAAATLPPAVAVSMLPGGGIALGAVFGSIIAQPAQLLALFVTLARFRKAYASLKLAAKAAGPRLAFDQR
jgi:hypothetical protein